MIEHYKKIPLWLKILIGLVVGVVLGIVLGEKALYLKWVGDIFVDAIKMLIVPLVLSSLIVGVTSIDDMGRMGRIGFKTLATYFLTTIIAVAIGLGLSMLTKLGHGVQISTASGSVSQPAHTATLSVASFIPTNPIAAMANGDILAIIVFAIIFGVSINLTGKIAEPVKNFFHGLAEVMYKMTAIIMELAPYGVAALIACVIGKQGIAFMLPLLKVIGIVYLACFFHALVILGGGVFIIGRLNPVQKIGV